MIVRRFEIADEDGTINVQQHDEVVQDRKGTWFAERWRSGRVAERGAALTDEAGGLATSVYVAKIRFLGETDSQRKTP